MAVVGEHAVLADFARAHGRSYVISYDLSNLEYLNENILYHRQMCALGRHPHTLSGVPTTISGKSDEAMELIAKTTTTKHARNVFWERSDDDLIQLQSEESPSKRVAKRSEIRTPAKRTQIRTPAKRTEIETPASNRSQSGGEKVTTKAIPTKADKNTPIASYSPAKKALKDKRATLYRPNTPSGHLNRSRRLIPHDHNASPLPSDA
ncbi:hypothetical protein CONLIGDRAFT_684967 [Coniochaeta ligniaria NRRL 30616]|uniref:Uncharacterized protein n=1 Tax=Coniochaeta ligniaria NRRL 30616 TaxID=1408157 RepID=A0A1J7ICD7_9PEZI|nr:hypothetical protein CONLIGDRAFT_684967 [Coniochaeta ligniaria NRRL 30616]